MTDTDPNPLNAQASHSPPTSNTDLSSPGSDSTLNVSVDFQAVMRNQRERERSQRREGSHPASGTSAARPTRVWAEGQATPYNSSPSSRHPRNGLRDTTVSPDSRSSGNRNPRRPNARMPDGSSAGDRRTNGRSGSTAGDAALWEERKRLLEEYHTRARQMINFPLRLLHAPILSDDLTFIQPLCFCKLFCPCMYNQYQKYHFETSPSAYMQSMEPQGPPFPMSPRSHLHLDEAEEQVGSADRYPPQGAPSGCCHNISRLLYRFFCLPCAVAQQTSAIYTDREQHRLVQPSFLCSCFYTHPRNYSRSVWAMVCCDIFSLGIPCCLCWGYRGMGTALYAWRLRYWIRCRYGLKGTAIGDLCSVLYCPLLAVDQQATELEMHGVHEYWGPSPPLDYYTLQ